MNNPYESPLEEGSPPERRDTLSLVAAIFEGAAWSVGSTVPIAALMVSFFRFPIPFGGIVTGPKYLVAAMIALLMYGVFLGGYLLVAVAGGVAGAVGRAIGSTRARQRLILSILAIGASFVLLFMLATLDWVIGPW